MICGHVPHGKLWYMRHHLLSDGTYFKADNALRDWSGNRRCPALVLRMWVKPPQEEDVEVSVKTTKALTIWPSAAISGALPWKYSSRNIKHHMPKVILCGIYQTAKCYKKQKLPLAGNWLREL